MRLSSFLTIALAMAGLATVGCANEQVDSQNEELTFGFKYCRPPSVNQCLSPSYHRTSCGRQYQARCQIQLGSYASNYAEGLERVQDLITRGEDESTENVEATVAVEERSRSNDRYDLDATSYSSWQGYEQHLSRRNLGGWVDLSRDQWEQNGARVNSCREFAYELAADYGSFEDEILASDAESGRDLFDALFQSGGIGADLIRDPRLFDRAGRETGRFSTVQSARNVFHTQTIRQTLNTAMGDDFLMEQYGDFLRRAQGELGDRAQGWGIALPSGDDRIEETLALHRIYGTTMGTEVERYRPLPLAEGGQRDKGYLDEELNRLHERQERVLHLASDYPTPEIRLINGRIDPATSRDNRVRFVAYATPIIEALIELEAEGCMESGITACDWSPRRFQQSFARMARGNVTSVNRTTGSVTTYETTLADARQTWFTRCIDMAPNPDNLSSLPRIEAEVNGIPRSWVFDYTRNAAALERYFATLVERDLWIAEQTQLWAQRRLREHEELVDHNGALRYPEESHSGRGSIGNSYLGAGYVYNASYALRPDASCDLEAEFDVGFTAAANVLNTEGAYQQQQGNEPAYRVRGNYELLHAHATFEALSDDLYARGMLADFNTDLRVLGASLLEDNNASDGRRGITYTIARNGGDRDWGDTDSDSANPNARHMFVGPLGITFRVDIGASFQAGLEYAGSFDIGQRGTCGETRTLASAMIRPFLNASGYIEGGPDLLIAAGGVGGEVTLIDASMPVNLELTSRTDRTADGDKSIIALSASLGVDLTAMSGRVYLWGELGPCPFCTRGEVDIVSFPPLVEASPTLWNDSWAVRFEDFQNAGLRP